jgi:YYY domain-containing protein
MAADILTWWLTIQGFGLAGLPLARWLFRSLPDRGYAFAKSLGLLLAGYLAWLLAMLGLAPFGRALVIVCALAAGLAGLLLAKDPRPEARDAKAQPPTAIAQNLAAIRDWLVAEWRLVLAYEALFALALVFLALLRSYNPAPWGTERPMDYALFNAIRISPSFPPHDPWLSGYSINYYYFGYLLMAVVSLASGIGEGTAYNLSLALIFALTALGVAGVVVNLIRLHRGEEPRTKNQEPHGRRSVLGSWFLVLLTVVLVLGVGNLGGALELISGTPKILELTQRDFLRAVSNGLGARAPLTLDQPYKAWGEQDLTTAITPTEQAGDFNWWNPSRALWDSARQSDDPNRQLDNLTRYYTITEFPFFSFWLGDMHPHVMSLPFTLLALALALQTLARPSAPSYTAGQRGWAELALTGIVLGSLYLINSWDLPTYLLLYLAALVLLYVRLGAPPGPGADAPAPLARVWWRHLLPQAAAVLLAAWMLFAPFHLTFKSLVGGKDPLIDVPLLATITRTIGFVTWTKTSLHTFLIIFGLFLVPLVAFLLAQGRGAPARAGLWRYPWAVLLGTLVFGLIIGFPLLVLLPLALYTAALALERADHPADAFALAGFALICLVCLGTEVVYIRDVFEMRMNTIFKFYYQAWLVWGLLAGYAGWRLAGAWPKNQEPRTENRLPAARGSRFLVLGSTLLFALFLTGALVYPWMTAGKSFREGQRSGLDGKTPTERTPEGAASIEWLRANVPGDAVVLEAVGDDYDGRGIGANGVSASTGLATVLGWPGHQDQWRGGDPAVHALIDPRKADVATIYSSTDTAAARDLLRKYGVDYIYVGPAERATYPAEGFAKFDQLGDPVFQQGDVTIYRVKQ